MSSNFQKCQKVHICQILFQNHEDMKQFKTFQKVSKLDRKFDCLV